jgi:4-amino-4-deoxy-L-arabinose transferase-like glycosyltransferase
LVGLIRSIRDAWQDDFTRFLALWFLVVLVLFSLAGTKLPHYIVYGLPPVFMLGQRVYLDRNRRMMLLASPLLILPLCGLALPALVNRVSISTANPYLAEMFWQGRAYFDLVFGLKAFGWFALSLFIFLGSLRVETRSARLRLLAAMGLVSAVGVSVVLLPAVTYFQQDPVREAAMVARGLHQPVISDNRMPSFSVYLGAPTEVRAPRAGDIAFGRLDHLDRLGHQYETLYARQGIRLVRVIVP